MSPAEVLERAPGIGGGRPDVPAPRDGDGGRGEARPDVARFGLWLLLATLAMMFIGFTSAYVVRRASADWRALPLPSVLVWNTLALLASSACLELARRAHGSWDLSGAQRWLAATGGLGALFAAGQTVAWRQLAEMGIFLSSNPHSSFFYLLTGVHLVHLAVGLAWFVAAFSRLRRMADVPGEDGLGLFAIYWHFLGALWAYLLVVLYLL
jgi:cytochrome c oxidase subunit 3